MRIQREIRGYGYAFVYATFVALVTLAILYSGFGSRGLRSLTSLVFAGSIVLAYATALFAALRVMSRFVTELTGKRHRLRE